MKTETLPRNFQELSWHQQQGLLRRYKLRDIPAHIYGAHGLKSLCGYNRPQVTIEPQYRNNPANLCCKRCKAAADKLNLPLA